MPKRPNQEIIEAAAEYAKGAIDPKATLERIIESSPEVTEFLLERGLIEVVEGGSNAEGSNTD